MTEKKLCPRCGNEMQYLSLEGILWCPKCGQTKPAGEIE